jgi:translation initiation factor eIF-2B subunit epsilon
MHSGDEVSDLDLSDPGSVTSSENEDTSDSEDGHFGSLSRTSSATSLSAAPPVSLGPLASSGDEEFASEVRLSLERAFDEGHSVDNASVELKTLRMASNVPIARVREAVVGSIVDRIKIVEGNPAQQRKEIGVMVDRWGELITKIGGADAVETVAILQVRETLGSLV